MKKSSCLDPEGLDYWYLASPSGPLQVCSNYRSRAKNGPASGSHFYIGLYRENVKKSSCLEPEGLDYWYLASPSGPLQVCSNYRSRAKNGPASGSHFLHRLI